MADTAANSAMSWFTVFVTLLSTFLGFLTSFISERSRDRRTGEREKATAEATRAREREAREATRRGQLFERRANFQRETLLNLQDAVVKLARAAGRMHHFSEMDQRKTGKWGAKLFPAELDDDSHYANVTIMVLTARVRDDRIRRMAADFRSHANYIGISRTQQEDAEALDRMSKSLGPLHERIGEVLRKLDDDEDAQNT